MINLKFLRNVLLKALGLFIFFNLIFAALDPLPALGRLSLYNVLFPGRERFPFGETPEQAYNFSLYSVEAMFASHEINAAAKAADEYRVLIIGDSSVWGTLLKPEETIAGQINAARLTTCDGKRIRAFNLGYPTISLTKDLMILQEAMRYQPDQIVWLVTLQAFPLDRQLASPLVANNPGRIRPLIAAYNLPLDVNDSSFQDPDFWGRTIIGQRRALADWLRLQIYGVMWASTGIDQFYPAQYEPAQRDFAADDLDFNNQPPPTMNSEELAFEMLRAGHAIAGDVPLLLVNEPILISQGGNSDLRYNFFYPRWAYDLYRLWMDELVAAEGWDYLDLWDLVDESQFTNSAIHMNPAGTGSLAATIGTALQTRPCPPAADPIPTPIPTLTATAVPPATATPALPAMTSTAITPTVEVIVPTPTFAADAWKTMPVLPTLGARAQDIYRLGRTLGNDPHAFSKIGDCETASEWFLAIFDRPNSTLYRLGEYTSLQMVLDHFSGSFKRKSLAARIGFNSATLLSPNWADADQCQPGESPLVCELRVHKPAFAIIALGTNDAGNPAKFEPNLRTIIETCIERGVVPILSTKADNLEGDHRINAVIGRLAYEYDIPLWNFWLAVQPLPGRGLSEDGVHLTWAYNYFDDPAALRTAWVWRNLTALQTLERMLQAVP